MSAISTFLSHLTGRPGPSSAIDEVESKRYTSLPTSDHSSPTRLSSSARNSSSGDIERGLVPSSPYLGGAASRIIHPTGKRRFRLGLLLGGAVTLVLLVGTAKHTGALDKATGGWSGISGLSGPGVYPITEWEGAREDRPEQWGWTEEMGWMEDESSMYLGEVGEGTFRLGFKKGLEGTEWYIKHLQAFAKSLPAPISSPLLNNLRAHFTSYYSTFPLTTATASETTADSSADDSQSYSIPGPMVEYKNVFQTDRDPAPEAEARWNKANGKDGWSVDFYDDARAQSWMEETFGGSDVEWAWDFMKRGVLRADFLRYMLPLVKGGVYVDVDTIPVRPIEEWGTHNVEYLDISFTDGPSWRDTLAARPSVIVGIDVDVHRHTNWVGNWPRPLGICQWALSSAPHHPIMLDAVRRVVNATHVVENFEKERDEKVAKLREQGMDKEAEEVERWGDVMAMPVMEWTGPGLFTDAVTAFLLARYGVTWHRLRNLDHPLRIGDVLIMPITSFSPGGEADFGSGTPQDRQSALIHDFRGSWKSDGL